MECLFTTILNLRGYCTYIFYTMMMLHLHALVSLLKIVCFVLELKHAHSLQKYERKKHVITNIRACLLYDDNFILITFMFIITKQSLHNFVIL